jgi:hypothetical protein
MADRSQARSQLRLDIEFEQASHLPVAILLDHIDSIVPLNEFVHLAGKGIRPQAEIISLQPVFLG